MEYKYEEVSLEELNEVLDNLRKDVAAVIPDWCVDGQVLENKCFYHLRRHNFDGGKDKRYPITIHAWTFAYVEHDSDGVRAFLLNKKPIDISELKPKPLIIGVS